jgi:hypothetical protein
MRERGVDGTVCHDFKFNVDGCYKALKLPMSYLKMLFTNLSRPLPTREPQSLSQPRDSRFPVALVRPNGGVRFWHVLYPV